MDENLFDKLNEIAGGQPERLNILEDQIDVKLQMEYFKYSSELKKKMTEEEKENFVPEEHLIDASLTEDELKENLVKLASDDDPKAFRLLEQFVAEKRDSLQEWGILAMQEGKMLLESTLLDENQVFISTGLGGRGNMLRYFVVLIGKEIEAYSEFQQNIVKSEFDFALREGKSEIEEVVFDHDIAMLTLLIPFEVKFQHVFKKAIVECNQYGDFLKDNFLVTNVKKLGFEEIKEFLAKNKMPTIEDLDDVNYEIDNDEE